MTPIEDRLRAATLAAAQTVHPGTAPPLRLPDNQRQWAGWGRRRASWTAWATPVAAAVGVGAVVTGSLVAAHQFGSTARNGHQSAVNHRPPATPLLAHPPTVDGLPPFFATVAGGPRANLSAGSSHPWSSIAVVSTATGQTVATVRLPGYAHQIAAGSDGRTFYVASAAPGCRPADAPPRPVPSPRGAGPANPAAFGTPSPLGLGTPSPVPTPSPGGSVTPTPHPSPSPSVSIPAPSPTPSPGGSVTPTPQPSPSVSGGGGSPTPTSGPHCQQQPRSGPSSFYRITLTASGAQLRKLPIPAFPGQLDAISPSPDGTRLAITSYVIRGQLGLIRRLTVASTVTGQARTWTTPQPGSMGGRFVGWLADGHTVAFDWLHFTAAANSSALWLLDTAVAGRDLLAGREVMSLDNSSGVFKSALVSPDGSTVVGAEERDGGVVNGTSVPVGSVVAFSARTGRATGVLFSAGRRPDGAYLDCQAIWLSRTGSRALASCDFSPSGTTLSQARVLLLELGHAPRPLPQFADAPLAPGALGEP